MLFFIFRRARRVGFVILAASAAGLIAGLLSARRAGAQASPTLTFLYLRGADTLGTETLRITDSSAVGVLAMRGQPRMEWTQHRRGGALTGLSLRAFAAGSPADAAPLQTANVVMQGDSAIATLGSATQRIASKAGALPMVNQSVLHMMLLSKQMHDRHTTPFDVFLVSGAQTVSVHVVMKGDTLVTTLGPLEARALNADAGAPGVITTSQGIRVERMVGAPSPDEAAALGRINYDAPTGAPYTAEQARIPTGRGYELAATLTRPVRSTLVPVVITISGSGPQDRDSRIAPVPDYALFRQIADTLGRRGVAVLRFDDRGVGESGGLETMRTATSADFADDVRSIVTWLRARSDIDGARIALVGHSEGGMIAPMVASTDPDIRAIVLMAGTAYTGRRIIMYQNRLALDDAPGLTRAQRDSIYATVPARLDSAGAAGSWLGFFMKHDPVATAKLVKQPTLVLQGEKDMQVTAEQALTLVASIRSNGNRNVTLRKFASTNHLFQYDTVGSAAGYATLADRNARKDVMGELADWVVRVLK